MWMTPEERRGAIVLFAILTLGAAWDLWPRRPMPLPPPRFAAAETTAIAPANAQPASVLPESSEVRLDLNRATAAALDALPGIGPVLAGRIVAFRERRGPFRRPEDLLGVTGIGPRLLDRLRPLVTIGPSSRAPMQSAQRRDDGRADSTSARSGAFR